MNRLGIPQDRIAKRLGQTMETIRDHLAKMAELPNPPNADLSRGFTVSQVAEKHNWTEPMVWSLALEAKEDLERFKELGWGLRPRIFLFYQSETEKALLFSCVRLRQTARLEATVW